MFTWKDFDRQDTRIKRCSVNAADSRCNPLAEEPQVPTIRAGFISRSVLGSYNRSVVTVTVWVEHPISASEHEVNSKRLLAFVLDRVERKSWSRSPQVEMLWAS